MRKTLLIITILGISLISTACINKFAVQELNNKAQALMKEGNTAGAIARLESSIDLDESIFETHYNLAVAYLQIKKYDAALKSLEKVKELNAEFADAYHSTAVAYEEKAYAVINGETEEQNESESDESDKAKKVLTDADKKLICDYLGLAIDNYNTYLMKKSDASDKDKVNARIEELNNEMRKYSEDTTVQTDNVLRVE